MGRKDRARVLIASVVDEDPRTPGALLVLAEISRADGNAVQAIADPRRALAVDGSPEVQLEFGRGLAALGQIILVALVFRIVQLRMVFGVL